MTRYISNPDNLKLMMNMLKEKSRNIQFEAFHVFKVQWLIKKKIYIEYSCDHNVNFYRYLLLILTNPSLFSTFYFATKTNL